jgi:hypothetical protein
MLDFIFTLFRVIESFMDGTVKEQRFRTKNVVALTQKSKYGKNPGRWVLQNLLTQFSHVLHLYAAVFTIY